MRRVLVGFVFLGLVLSSWAAFASDAGPVDAGAAVEAVAEAPAAVVAEAPAAVEELPETALDAAQKLWQFIADGEWMPAVFLALMLVTFGLRWGASKLSFLKFFTTRIGGYILVFAGSTAGVLGTSAAAGADLNMKALMTAVTVGFAAIGGWETVKDLLLKKSDDSEEEDDEE
jgi:hypothetical protein